MRLPFGLGRRSGSGDGASSGSSGASSPTVSRSATSGPASVPAPSRAWASLPPIQRTTGSMPLVAAPDSFVDELPGSQGLPPIVEPLGHEVSSLAAPGLVVARTRAIDAPTNGSMPAPVQRRAARGARTAAAVQREADDAEAPELPSPSVMPVQAMATPEAAAEPELPIVAPIRTMPTVSRQSIHVPDRPLTSAASAARPAAVQRAEAAATAAASGASTLPMPASGGMRRVPSGSAPSMPVVSRQAASPAGEPAATLPALPSPAAQPAAVQRSAATPATTPSRLGLGEPITSLPASARPIGSPASSPVVSRTTTSGPMPVSAAPLLPAVQRSEADGEDSDGGSMPVVARQAMSAGSTLSATLPASMPVQRSAASAALPNLPALPVLPVARPTVSRSASADEDELTVSSVLASGSSSGGAGASAAASTAVQLKAAPEIRPIAAANPIRPSFVLQRSGADATDDEPSDQPDLPSPWWAPASEARSGAGLPGAAGHDGGFASTQRSAASTASSQPSVPFGSPAYGAASSRNGSGPSARATAVQRSASSGSPALPPARGTAPDPIARVSGAPAASTPAPVAATAPAHVPGITAGPVVQTSAAPATPVQRAPSITFPAASVQREPGVGSAVGSSTSHGGHAGSGGGRGHSEKELEELSQMLFSRIRNRLRADLIHDREAKGLTFDNV